MAIHDLRDMVGKTLLVAVVYVDESDNVTDKLRFGGIVTAVEPVVTIDWGGDEPFTLPPEPEAFDAAEPGEYRLADSDDVYIDPDYLTSWRVLAEPDGA